MATTNHSKVHTFLIGQESVYGTPVTADKDVGLVQNFTPSDKRTIEKNRASGSREIQELTAGKAEFNWDLELKLQNGRMFEYTFGSVAHALTSNDTKHTFSVASTLPAFTIESSFNTADDDVFIYQGSKVDTAVINLDTNGILKGTFSGISQLPDTSTAAASAAVISALKVLAYKHATLSTGTAGAESSVGKLQTFNLNITNTLEPIDAAGTFVTQELSEGDFEMAFDFTMIFDSLTEYNIALGGTAPALAPTEKSALFNANNGVTLGSGRREFEIQLDGFLYEEVGVPTTVGEKVVASFKGTATGLGSNGCFYVDNVTEAAFS